MGREISQLKRKLTNLSSANPMLWMGRLRAGIHVDVARLLFDTAVSPEDFLNQLCSGKRNIRLAPVFNPRNPAENKTGAQLQRLARFRLLEKQERGTDHLFIAWPFAAGQWPDGTAVRTPFQLIPCDLTSDGKYWNLKARPEDAILNPAFMLAYAHHCSKPLEERLFEKNLEVDATDAREYLTLLYEKVRDSLLDINFNSDLFSLQLQDFTQERKPEFNAGGPGILRLFSCAVLGLFPLSDSVLLPDFEELEKSYGSLEDLFTRHAEEKKNQPYESDLLFPLSIDGSQEACLREIFSGKNLLIQGPPGSGKSQLITNLAASASAAGKSVLIVCQKRVALEVVSKRLDELGIGRHVAMWADFRNDVSALYASIAKQIEELEETESRNKALDTVILEREFHSTCQEISRICRMLEEWKSAIFDDKPAGISIHELKKIVSGNAANKPDDGFLRFRYQEWLELERWFSRYGSEVIESRPFGTLLANRGIWPNEKVSEILSLMENCTAAENSRKAFLREKGCAAGKESIVLVELASIADSLPEVPMEFLEMPVDTVLSIEFRRNFEAKARGILKLLNALKAWPASLINRKEELNQVLMQLRENADSGKFVLKVKALFAKELRPLIFWHNALEKAGFSDPKMAIEAAGELENLCSGDPLFESFSLFAADGDRNANLLSEYINILHSLEKNAVFMQKIKRKLPKSFLTDLRSLFSLARQIVEMQHEKASAESILSNYFPFLQPDIIIQKLQEELASIKNKSLQISRADGLLSPLPEHWQEIILNLLAQPEISFETIRESWAASWIEQLENQSPILRAKKEWFQAEIQLLQKHIKRKQTLAQSIIRLKLEEETHRNLERNRLQNRTTYRGLYHQVTRKRQRPPLRTLWLSHGSEIQKLIPVWLATPESVSATWTLEMKFDLVIFDEASQCFAEKGIPAMARGRQLVVIGDGKQLPPNHLFSTRWEEESNPDDALFSEQDSLLDLARQFFPSRMLHGHYRSRYPELIAFSNENFYDGKLQVIPGPETLSPRKSVVRFVRVDGSWENRCNEAEALWIADNAIRFFSDNPASSLGIICFNTTQQEKIEAEVMLKSAEQGVFIPETFFVKNIENVQGDERDLIWFSLGYAANASGNLVSQFGSLSQEGGENRLNVAITRARLGITLVSSLSPQEWQFAARLARGPALLAAYVQFAGELSAHPYLAQDFALGSLATYCDEVSSDGTNSKLILKNINAVFEADSMKAQFGLRPLMNADAGYDTEFRYWDA